MAQKTSSFERFWKELKRRKVFGVITTYAATAYIIIEVTNNLVEPLHLPGWVATMVVLLLVTGLPVIVVLSWIFDFTSQGIKMTGSLEESEKDQILIKPAKGKLRPSHILNAILIIAVIVLAYPRIFRRDSLERLRSSGGRISVAVMPFQNLTNDTLWNVWQTGIQNELIASLTNSEDLKVRQTETINSLLKSRGLTNYASIVPPVASKISRNLDANVLVSGSINRAGTTIRLSTQLINPETQDVFKSFQIDGTSEGILYTIDSLSAMVRNYLIISKLAKDLPIYLQYHPGTSSPEAFRYYLYGENARSKRDFPLARKMFGQALDLDSNFAQATLMLSVACINQGLYEEAKEWGDKAYDKRDQMPIRLKLLTYINYASFYETPLEKIKYLKQFLEIDDKYPGTYYDIGLNYSIVYQYDKAIPEFEKALRMYDRLDSKPWWIYDYTELGYAYHKTGQYKKERKIYKRAEKDFPDEANLLWREAILSLTLKDTLAADEYIDKYRAVYKANSWSEAALERNMGWGYTQAGMPDKAEESFRKAISLEPGNGFWKYHLAKFLIDNDRDINEGMTLIDKALELSQDQYQWIFLDCRGWGLYKQGKYQEALKQIEKSWEMRPVYSHETYLHLEEAKKAVAGQNN